MSEQSTSSLAFIDLKAQRLQLGDRVDRNLARVLEHGKFIMGPEVHELEQRLAQRAGVTHVVTCSSGTDALLLPLLAWGIGRGDAVFVPSFTFTATAEVVALLGATPVFCDVEPHTFNLDPDSLQAAIDEVTRTAELKPRVVIPVDLFGQPADYPDIERIAAAAELRVLADAAQSFGATLDGRPVGSFGAATATSFFPAKPLGCFGDGGAVFTNDDHLASVMRSLRVHGKGTDKYDTVRIGLNARLDTLQAAVLLAKLEIFDDELRRRRDVADRYTRGLREYASTPPVGPDRSSTWAQLTIRLPDRDRVAGDLRGSGVPTAVYYPQPLHRQPAFRGARLAPAGCPVSEFLSHEVLSLPMHPYLTGPDQDHVMRVLRQAVVDRQRD